MWQEQHFCASEMFGADGDEVFVWKLESLLFVHFRSRFMHYVVIRADIAQLLFHVSQQQRTGTKSSGSPCTWRAYNEGWEVSLCDKQRERRIVAKPQSLLPPRTPSIQSGAPRRRPRAWSQVYCIFQHPGQRGVTDSLTAFRRSSFRLHHRRLHQRRFHHWRLRHWSLQHALGEHRSLFSPLPYVLEAVQHFRHVIAGGRRGARIEGRHFGGCGNFGAAGQREARIEGRHFGLLGKFFRERRMNQRPLNPQQQ